MRQNKKKHRLAEVSSRRRGCRVWCSVHLYIYSRGLPANPSATTTPTSPATILTLHPHSHNPCHTLLFLFTTAVTGRSSGPIIMQPLLFFFTSTHSQLFLKPSRSPRHFLFSLAKLMSPLPLAFPHDHLHVSLVLCPVQLSIHATRSRFASLH